MSADFSKLSNAVDYVVKKVVNDKLFGKVNIIDTNLINVGLLGSKTQYNQDKQNLEKNIANVNKKIRYRDWNQRA